MILTCSLQSVFVNSLCLLSVAMSRNISQLSNIAFLVDSSISKPNLAANRIARRILSGSSLNLAFALPTQRIIPFCRSPMPSCKSIIFSPSYAIALIVKSRRIMSSAKSHVKSTESGLR